MEASTALVIQSCSRIGTERSGRKLGGFVKLQNVSLEERRIQSVSLGNRERNRISIRSRNLNPVVVSCRKKSEDSESWHNPVDALLLKRKSENVILHLNGQCIYLVGMMASGKTTVGKILAEVLGYNFIDSDKWVEQFAGMPIPEIFKEHGETYFRDSESEVLKSLSSMKRLVVATGGGAVIRPINWSYMKESTSLWLDVPLEALAKRVAAVGTASRPLLNQESDDPYTLAFARLSGLMEQRGEAYANADATVSLKEMAERNGHGDAELLTPTDIVKEAVQKIESLLLEKATDISSTLVRG